MRHKRSADFKFEIDKELMKAEFETAKARFSKEAHILAIKECGAEVFPLAEQQMLEAVGLEGCTALQYFADCYDQNAGTADQIAGRHIGVLTAMGRLSVILLRDQYVTRHSDAFVAAYKVCTLYHEVGHAEDFRRGINFNHTNKTTRPKEAEEFADSFAKRRLQHIKCHEMVKGEPPPPTLWDFYSSVRHKGSFVS
jgi:hypothetical protein